MINTSIGRKIFYVCLKSNIMASVIETYHLKVFGRVIVNNNNLGDCPLSKILQRHRWSLLCLKVNSAAYIIYVIICVPDFRAD